MISYCRLTFQDDSPQSVPHPGSCAEFSVWRLELPDRRWRWGSQMVYHHSDFSNGPAVHNLAWTVHPCYCKKEQSKLKLTLYMWHKKWHLQHRDYWSFILLYLQIILLYLHSFCCSYKSFINRSWFMSCFALLILCVHHAMAKTSFVMWKQKGFQGKKNILMTVKFWSWKCILECNNTVQIMVQICLPIYQNMCLINGDERHLFFIQWTIYKYVHPKVHFLQAFWWNEYHRVFCCFDFFYLLKIHSLQLGHSCDFNLSGFKFANYVFHQTDEWNNSQCTVLVSWIYFIQDEWHQNENVCFSIACGQNNKWVMFVH